MDKCSQVAVSVNQIWVKTYSASSGQCGQGHLNSVDSHFYIPNTNSLPSCYCQRPSREETSIRYRIKDTINYSKCKFGNIAWAMEAWTLMVGNSSFTLLCSAPLRAHLNPPIPPPTPSNCSLQWHIA